ncbi:MAG: hypothetical protein RAK24_04880, partial [TACK group archaeon]|nr:hypothetical protein [TACK group archaeon]
VSLVGIYVSSEFLIRGSRLSASMAGWSGEAAGAVILSLASALPEVLTGAVSSVGGAPALGIGTLLGSTVVISTAVPSLLVLAKGDVVTKGRLSDREAVVASASNALVIGLLVSGLLVREVGTALMLAYAAYLLLIARGEAIDQDYPPARAGRKKAVFALLMIVSSSLLLYASASLAVSSSLALAQDIGFSEFLVGVVVLGIGVELPEIALSVMSSGMGEKGMALGGILGSNTAKALLGLGLMSALGGGLSLPLSIQSVSTAAFSLISPLILYMMIRTGFKLSRLDAAMLLLLYGLYLGTLFLR